MSKFSRFKEDLGWKLRGLRDSWERLPAVLRWAGTIILLLASLACLVGAFWITFVGKGETEASRGAGEVVLYTSTDSFLLQPIVDEFERDTGIKVRVVGDTEATKTTGLVERLIAEKDAPRCDVWWSNEVLGSVILARRGVLEPARSKAEIDFPKGWPAAYRDPDLAWYGFALRARVIAFNTNRFQKTSVPTRLRDLARADLSGRIGMARPQFGTTRLFIAWLVSLNGDAPIREWLHAMKTQGLRLYDGNSAVVQALSTGEIDIGLTDSDDVYAGKRNQWPVDFVLESADKPNSAASKLTPHAVGPLIVPNTAGLILGRPHPNEAQRLVNFLLSARVERSLAQSDARTIPLREEVAKEFKDMTIPDPAGPADWREIERALPAADALIAELFPPGN